MKKIKLTDLMIYIVKAELVGALSALIAGGWGFYTELVKPPLSPPGTVFGIVWPVLYALMGISAYLISSSDSKESPKQRALNIYAAQLAVNFLWSILFFRFRLILAAAIDIAVLIILVAVMISRFRKIRPSAAYLNIPYLLWLIYALYLNVGIYILNR